MIALGPCPCRGCGKPVTWNGSRWCDRDGLSHSCPRSPKIGRRYWLTPRGAIYSWIKRD